LDHNYAPSNELSVTILDFIQFWFTVAIWLSSRPYVWPAD